MKRKLLLAAVTLVAAVFGGGGKLSAQGWTASEVGAGDYYLYNVGAGKFLTSGNWWGTHAAVDDDGMRVTLAGSGTDYTISTAVAFAGRYLGSDAYMDNGTAATWTFTKVGDTNNYTMKNGDNYFVWTGGDVADNTTTAPTTGNGYWQLVTKEQLIANLNNATPANPIDASFYMTNPKVRRNWPRAIEGTGLNDNGSFNAGVGGLYAGGCTSYGQWHKTFDNYQALTGVKNGKYKVRVKGVNRIDDGDNTHDAYLYANDQKGANFKNIVASDYSGFNGSAAEQVTHLFVDDTYLLDWLEVTVTDGNLRVGVKSDANVGWATFAQFTLMFVDPYISSIATEIPSATATALTADKWYKFTAASTGNYSFATTTIANITYTTTDQFKSEAATSATATALMELTAGTTYYIKSSSTQTLTITPQTFSYNVGDATLSVANGAYTQSNTLTLTYSAASTDNPSGTFQILDATKITVGGVAASASINDVTKVLTITLADPLVNDADYVVSVAAGAVGYNAEHANAAIELTLHTPAVFDGTYFIATSDGTQFISRGGNSNTEAVLDEFGIAATFQTDAANVTTITFVDNNKPLAGGSQSVYTNKTAAELEAEEAGKGARVNWTVSVDDDGYNIKSILWNKYIKKGVGAEFPYYPTVATYDDAAYKWMLVAPATHATIMATYKDANAAKVATDAGLTGITTVADLKTELAAHYTEGTENLATEAYASVSEKYQPSGYTEKIITQELTGLKNGIYKVTISAFHRIKDNDATYACYQNNTDNPTSYLYANNQKMQLPSVMSEYAGDAYTGGDNPNYSPESGKNYPNNTANAGQAFDNERYKVEVFAVVTDGTLNIGLTDPGKYTDATWAASNWICFRDLAVTAYTFNAGDYTALDAAITAAESTYPLGFDVDEYAPYENVAACEALAAAKTMNTNHDATSQAKIDAATTALTGATWYANAVAVDAIYDGDLENAPIQSTSENVVLPGWVTKSGNTRQTFKGNGGDGKACLGDDEVGLFVHPGTYNYGETPGYTMPLKAGFVYEVEAKYCSWAENSNSDFTLTILMGGASVATKSYGANKTACTTAGALKSVKLYFTPSVDGDYTLSVVASGNTFMTGFHITKVTSITIDEDVTYDNTIAGTVDVTLNRTIKAGYNSLVLPFSMTQAKVEETFGAGSKVYIIGDYADESITFAEQSGIVANKPCILLATEASAAPYALTGCTLVAGTPTDNSVANIEFVGSYAVTSPITKDDDNYVLSNGKLYLVDSDGVTMKGTRAYFHLATPSPIKALNVVFEDEEGGATAIANINSKKAADGTTFNMAGQRVGADYKGIVIKNGKKVLVK